MSRSTRTSAAQIPVVLACGLGGAVLATAGCSSDVTRFSLLGLGGSPAPAAVPAAPAPEPAWGSGRPTSWNGYGPQEATPPAPQGYRVVGRDPYPGTKAPDPSPPPWTDKDPLPWPPRSAEKAKPAVAASKAPLGPPRVVQVPSRPVEAAPEAKTPPERPQKLAKLDGGMVDTPPAPAAAAGRFRWPARGKIIVGFGTQSDGTKSEGINLSVPMGTDIHAAEAGRVHYVGDGVKGYGNLILIRHANDWVTAYAHADQVLVRANDEVKRGQVIGKAGKSGPVAQPQLHFELRKGSVPVDPVPHLAN